MSFNSKLRKTQEDSKDLNIFFMICASYTACHNSYRFYRFAQSQPNVKQPIQSGVGPWGTHPWKTMKSYIIMTYLQCLVKPSNFTGTASYCSLILYFTSVSNWSQPVLHILKVLQTVSGLWLPSQEWVSSAAPLWPPQCCAVLGGTLRHPSECGWNRATELRKLFQEVCVHRTAWRREGSGRTSLHPSHTYRGL